MQTDIGFPARLVSFLSLLQGRDALNKVCAAFPRAFPAEPRFKLHIPLQTLQYSLRSLAWNLRQQQHPGWAAKYVSSCRSSPAGRMSPLPLRSSHAAAGTIAEARRVFRAGAFIGHIRQLLSIDFASADVFGVAHLYSAVRHTCLAAYFSCDALLLMASLTGRASPSDSTYKAIDKQAHKFWSVGLVAALAQDAVLLLQLHYRLRSARLRVAETHGKLNQASGTVLNAHHALSSAGLSPTSPQSAARQLWPHGDSDQMAPPPPSEFAAPPTPGGPPHPQTPQPGKATALASCSKDPPQSASTPAPAGSVKSPSPSPIPPSPSGSPTHLHALQQQPQGVSLPTVHHRIHSLAEAARVLLLHRAQVRQLRAALSAVHWRLLKVRPPAYHVGMLDRCGRNARCLAVRRMC